MTQSNEIGAYKHPSGINLATIPGPQTRDKPEPTVTRGKLQGVLRALATELQAAMEGEAESFIGACQRMEADRIVKCFGRYEAFFDSYGLIVKLWDSLEFDGPPQPAKVWHTLKGHAIAIQQERQNDAAF